MTEVSHFVSGDLLRRVGPGGRSWLMLSPLVGWAYRCHVCGTGLFRVRSLISRFDIQPCPCGAPPCEWEPIALMFTPEAPAFEGVPGLVTRALVVMDDDSSGMEAPARSKDTASAYAEYLSLQGHAD